MWRWAEELVALPSCWTENAGWDWKSRHLAQLVRQEWQMERRISDRPAWSPETASRRWQPKALLSWHMWIWIFISPDILQACQKTHHRHQAAQLLLHGTGKACLCWRPGLRGEMGAVKIGAEISVATAEMGRPAGRTGSVLEVECVWGGLEVLRRKPGKWLRLTRWSSRRRAWELASSSRKWPGSCNGVSRSKIAKNRYSRLLLEVFCE